VSAMTETQWECLLDASHGTAEHHHGKTINSLIKKRLLVSERNKRIVLTIAGANRLHQRYPAGKIGKFGEDLR
jgi:hypothetical protein